MAGSLMWPYIWACKSNVLHVWFQFYSALCMCAHYTLRASPVCSSWEGGVCHLEMGWRVHRKNQLLVIWYTTASWESSQVHCSFCFDAAVNSEGQRLTKPLMSLVIDSAAQLATVGIAWSQYHDAVDCSKPVYEELLMTILQPLISHFELHILDLVKVANSWSIPVLHEAEDGKKHYSWHEIHFLKFQVWNDCLLVVYEC